MQSLVQFLSPLPETASRKLLATNDFLCARGLSLTPAEAISIMQRHAAAMRENRLIDLEGDAAVRILTAFADSPYVDRRNLAEITEEMLEAFSYLKREAPEEIGDQALITAMRQYFDEVSCGSMELFLGRELETLRRYLLEGRTAENGEIDYAIREEDDYGSEPDCRY